MAVFCFEQALAQQTLSLEESKKFALQNNYKILNSQLEINAAQKQKKAAVTHYFPTISVSGTGFRAQKDLFELTTQGGDLPVYDGNPANLLNPTQFAYFPSSTMGMFKSGTFGTLTAVQPVYAGGRIVNSNKLASLEEDVNKLKSRLSRNEVLLKTEEQYWLVVSLDEKLMTVHKYEAFLERLLRQVDDAYNVGISMKNDVLKVKLKRNEVLFNKSKLENGKKLAVMAFCQHIGIPYDPALVLKDSLMMTDLPQTYYIDKDEALKNRTEYHLLQASVSAEDLQTRMKLGEYLPQAAVGISEIFMKIDDGQDRTIGMVFGTLSVPLSGWWEAYHTLSRRSIKERIALNNLKDNSAVLTLQTQKAWQDFSDAYQQVLLSEEAKSQAEENLKVNQDSYDNGLTDVADLLEAQAILQHTNDQLTDAKTGYCIKRSFYLQVTGR
jgi:outer membrane protein